MRTRKAQILLRGLWHLRALQGATVTVEAARTHLDGGHGRLTELQLGNGAAGRRDFLLRAAGKGVRADLQGNVEIAGAEHLDRLAAADRAHLGQLVRADLAALREQLAEP